jgi:hypothetical protein
MHLSFLRGSPDQHFHPVLFSRRRQQTNPFSDTASQCPVKRVVGRSGMKRFKSKALHGHVEKKGGKDKAAEDYITLRRAKRLT